MATQRYSVTPHPIETLLTWVKSGEIAIPEVQRPFVWDAAKVRNVLDSLYQGYPIGYLIAWRNPTVKLRGGTPSAGKRILIDGQQRVTALMAALLGREILTKDYETVRIRIAFHPQDEKFEVANPAIRRDAAWIVTCSAACVGGRARSVLARRLVPPGEHEVARLAQRCELNHALVVHRDGDERVVRAGPVAEAGREERVTAIEDQGERVGRAGDHRHERPARGCEVAIARARRPAVAVDLPRVADAPHVFHVGPPLAEQADSHREVTLGRLEVGVLAGHEDGLTGDKAPLVLGGHPQRVVLRPAHHRQLARDIDSGSRVHDRVLLVDLDADPLQLLTLDKEEQRAVPFTVRLEGERVTLPNCRAPLFAIGRANRPARSQDGLAELDRDWRDQERAVWLNVAHVASTGRRANAREEAGREREAEAQERNESQEMHARHPLHWELL